MRHGNSGKSFSRTTHHREAMFKNMMVSLLRHECIKTTLLKAKELRRFLEPMITLAKQDTLHRRRTAYSRLRDRDMVTKLFADLGPFYKDRPGGYLRILKADYRKGDCAPMAVVMLVARQTATE
jgi:large subunit ribosomal protein L17